MTQSFGHDGRGQVERPCRPCTLLNGAPAVGSAEHAISLSLDGHYLHAMGPTAVTADGNELDVESAPVVSLRGSVLDALTSIETPPLVVAAELSREETSGPHADADWRSDRSTDSATGRPQPSLICPDWPDFDVPAEGVPKQAFESCRLDTAPLNCGPASDPRIGALQEMFAQHQRDMHGMFMSMVSSLQTLHGKHQQHLETFSVQAMALGSSDELCHLPSLDRIVTPASEQTEASNMDHHPDFNFQNTHDHAVEKFASTPSFHEAQLHVATPEEEPDLTPWQRWARRITTSFLFRASVTMVIALSSILLGWQSQHTLNQAYDEVPIQDTNGEARYFALAELGIGSFFAGELCLRLLAEGMRDFLRGPDRDMNIFDVCLVFFAGVHLFIVFVVHVQAMQFGRILQLVRLVRLTRLLRVLRVIRLLPKTFKLMVSSIHATLSHLVWVFLLLTLIMYSFSVVFINGVTEHFVRQVGEDPELDQKLLDSYGTVLDGLLTLFASISGGVSWQEVLSPLWEIGSVYGILFVAYIYFTVFGALNVLTSLFVDSVYKVSLRSRELSVQNEKDMAAIQSARIKSFFDEADVTKTGQLTLDQFVACLANDEAAAYFSSLGLDVSQAPELFDLLDVDNDNHLTHEEFVSGCMKLKGEARSLDVNMVLTEQRKMMHNWAKFMNYMEDELESVRRQVKRTGRRNSRVPSENSAGRTYSQP